MAHEANIPETKKLIINYSNDNRKRKEIENIRKQKIRGNTELKEKEFNYLLLVRNNIFV